MTQQTATSGETISPVSSRFAIRLFYTFAALAGLSVAISMAGKWLGGSIASVGHSDDTSVHEIVVGNNVLAVPANHIRFQKQRAATETHRLDLYMRWPDLAGYSDEFRDDFNHRDGSRRIVFLSVEARLMSRDMSGRFEPIYRRLIELPGAPAPGGLRAYRFRETSGYINELLIVGERPGSAPFVARCLMGAAAADSLASCERDVHFGDDLSLVYRFPETLLGQWRELDQSVTSRMQEFLRTGS
ncbi:MAG: hypothetical protein JJ913_16780 [Rhizobiaceae bacterium]|nr:hypothetical protein [Rhizobiaceae bacterium]